MKPTFQPKIIFFDIDDTLYIKDERRIANSTRYALQQLKQQGIITAIATGRSPAVLPAIIQDLMQETGIEMLVSINGQYVRHRQHTLASFPMPTALVEHIGNYFAQQHIAYACVSDSHISVSQETEPLQQAMRDLGIHYTHTPQRIMSQPVYQMLAFYPEEQDKRILAGLPNTIKAVRWHQQGIDLLEQQGSKARGIQAALNQLGLNMNDAMAFGDGLNDREMLQAVGLGVAMGNAHPDLKTIAHHIAPAVNEDGIYRALVDLGVIAP